MSTNNIHHTNEAHIPSQNNPPNEQHAPQYLADIEAEIQQSVNDALESEREKTVQSSSYTHYSRHRARSESIEAPSANDNMCERCRTTMEPATHDDLVTQKLQNDL
ncbi:hypothetical protein LIER_32773 [Lithospermum erythrorhizon]|uniref:Uncharacterized protein n=1 Tax=Lithospermum erythrorhizon TaxID=34254 RepID=A0AAV3RXA8_LITER